MIMFNYLTRRHLYPLGPNVDTSLQESPQLLPGVFDFRNYLLFFAFQIVIANFMRKEYTIDDFLSATLIS